MARHPHLLDDERATRPPAPRDAGGSTLGVPAAVPRDAVAVALGRHALSLIAQELRRRGTLDVLVGAFHCLTMTLPFQLEGMTVRHVAVGADLLPDPAALHAQLVRATRAGARPALLYCETFGAAPAPALAQELARARAAGVPLVVDATHSWLTGPHVRGDFEMASIRKMLPVPDGAWVRGLPGHPVLGRRDVDRAQTRAWLDGHVDLAEDLMDRALVPASMSPQALGIVAGVDVARIAAARRRDSAALRAAARELGLDVVSPPWSLAAFAFRHPRGARLVTELAARGVDGPVWWPRPAHWQGPPWPEDVVTLPLSGGPRQVRETTRHLRLALARPA